MLSHFAHQGPDGLWHVVYRSALRPVELQSVLLVGACRATAEREAEKLNRPYRQQRSLRLVHSRPTENRT